MAIINQLSNIASVLFNGTPVNSNPAITDLALPPTILKAVNSLIANIGDVLTYTVTITNVGLTALQNLPFTDVLPEGSTYVNASFEVNGATVSPTLTGNTLTYTIPTVAALGTATITFQATVVGGNI